MCIRDRNKVIVLEDKADVAAAKDGKLLVVLLCQFFASDNHGSAGGRDVYKRQGHEWDRVCSGEKGNRRVRGLPGGFDRFP